MEPFIRLLCTISQSLNHYPPCRMKIAAAIKFSSQCCLCATIHLVRTELLLLMLPWSLHRGHAQRCKERGVWQVSPTALCWLHVKPMSRHLLPPSVSPLRCSHHCLLRTSLAFFLVLCLLSLFCFLLRLTCSRQDMWIFVNPFYELMRAFVFSFFGSCHS